MEKFSKSVETDVEHYIDTPTRSIPNTELSEHRKSLFGLINERKLLWKIDLSILPILFCAYFLQFLDKVVYNVSGPRCVADYLT
jgi:hypothetical protein